MSDSETSIWADPIFAAFEEIAADMSPLDAFYWDYEQHLIGALEEPPTIDQLDESDREIAIGIQAFLEWRYEDGLGDSINRRPEMYAASVAIMKLPEV